MGDRFINKIIKGATHRVKSFFYNPFSEFGIPGFKLKKLKHQGYNRPGSIILKSIPVKYQHPPELLHSIREIFIDKIYKIDLAATDPYIIDCGANVGLSVINLKLQFPNATIIAFEPDSSNFQLLQYNTSSFNKVELVNKAVWDKETTIEFEMGGTQSSAIKQHTGDTRENVCTTVRLKDHLDKPVDFLKIDIEGAEYDVIRDCKDVLHNVKNLFLEYHGTFEKEDQLTELFVILGEAGFKYYIKEATNVYPSPFSIDQRKSFDIQLNIFAFKKP